MTTPTWDTFCCNYSEGNKSVDELINFDYRCYSVVCIVSASLGILGAIYQIVPIHHTIQRRSVLSGERQRKIIKLLATADLFACLGIIVRSILWLYYDEIKINKVSCAVISIWIMYFYTSTYMWTICYAIDVYFTVKESPWKFRYYHLISWGIAFIIVAAEFLILYFPKFECHSYWKHVFAHYFLSFLSMFIPMLLNPILYVLASNQARYIMQSHLGRYTDQERALIKRLQIKFSYIVVVYCVCWLPNIISCVCLWSAWTSIIHESNPSLRHFMVGLWYFMAIVNPLQAVLNSVVYRGWSNCSKLKAFITNVFRSKVILGIMPEDLTESERAEERNERELLLNTG